MSSEDSINQIIVCAGRNSIDRVVRAHYGADFSVPSTSLKRLQVELRQILCINDCIEAIPIVAMPEFDIVARTVLASGDNFVDIRILTALKPSNPVLDVRLYQEGIFARRFLTSTPTRISERLGVGCPVVES